MDNSKEESAAIEKLYEYGEHLSESSDKSKNEADYVGIIAAAKGSSKAKQLAAQLIPRFFKYFPSLSAQAINAQLDLCEEDELGIRVQAIRGLPLLCRDTPEHVPKIGDVLGQLLLAEEGLERDAVAKALMSVLRQDTKASLTALFKHIENSDENIREKVLVFVRERVFPLKRELLHPEAEMERHITDLIKKSLQDVTGAEFKMFMDFLKSLTLFNDKSPPERVQELLEIVEGQADLDAIFTAVGFAAFNDDNLSAPEAGSEWFLALLEKNEHMSETQLPGLPLLFWAVYEIYLFQAKITDTDHIDRLMSCLNMALPFYVRGASNSKFLNYINKHLLPVFDKLPEDKKLDLLKNLAESSPYTSAQDARNLLPSILQLLKTLVVWMLCMVLQKYMPRKKTGEELNFTFVECLLFTFHQLAHKTPNTTNSLCGYKIVTGQPSDRLGEDFKELFIDFTERLTVVEDSAKATNKKLTQGMSEHNKAMSSAKTDAAKADVPLLQKAPAFFGEKKTFTLSWKENLKPAPVPAVPSTGNKRAAPTLNGSGATAVKRGRGNGLGSRQLVNRALAGLSQGTRPGGKGGWRGGRNRGRGTW